MDFSALPYMVFAILAAGALAAGCFTSCNQTKAGSGDGRRLLFGLFIIALSGVFLMSLGAELHRQQRAFSFYALVVGTIVLAVSVKQRPPKLVFALLAGAALVGITLWNLT